MDQKVNNSVPVIWVHHELMPVSEIIFLNDPNLMVNVLFNEEN